MNAPVATDSKEIISDKLIKEAEAFAKRTSPEEALWLSGFFAGWATGRTRSAQAGTAPVQSAAAPGEKQRPSVRVIYGTETGNSSVLAETFAGQLAEKDFAVNCHNMADYKPQWLKQDTCLVIITSTHGDGDPPETAKPFFEFLESRRAPPLNHLRYAVLGLGDTSYEHFCAAARALDSRLQQLGAKPFIDRVELDVDFEAPANVWLNNTGQHLTALLKPDEPPERASVSSPEQADNAGLSISYNKSRPFPAEVLDSVSLTGRGSSKQTHHIELSLSGSNLDYQPGDALGVVPVNRPELIDGILGVLNLSGDEPVGDKTLRECLAADYEITTLTPRFIEVWAELSDAGALRRTLAQERASLYEYMANNQILDVMRKYAVERLEPAALLSGLRRLQPRLYSIASSPEFVPDEAHITVSRVEYELNQLTRYGVASSFLCDHGAPGTTVPVYIQKNLNFRLPADPAVPIIMIGAGTGIAPYRAFLQHREAAGATAGPAWLFFGERNFRTDFLYQLEWQQWLRTGNLDRISLAFSRDQADKVYVQHKLMDDAAEIFRWLEAGAVVYVCGDAKQMAGDVHTALIHIIKEEGERDGEQAAAYLSELSRDKRYRKDVY